MRPGPCHTGSFMKFTHTHTHTHKHTHTHTHTHSPSLSLSLSHTHSLSLSLSPSLSLSISLSLSHTHRYMNAHMYTLSDLQRSVRVSYIPHLNACDSERGRKSFCTHTHTHLLDQPTSLSLIHITESRHPLSFKSNSTAES